METQIQMQKDMDCDTDKHRTIQSHTHTHKQANKCTHLHRHPSAQTLVQANLSAQACLINQIRKTQALNKASTQGAYTQSKINHEQQPGKQPAQNAQR